MKMEEGFCFLDSAIQAKVLLDRLTKRIYSTLTRLKVNVSCGIITLLLCGFEAEDKSQLLLHALQGAVSQWA